MTQTQWQPSTDQTYTSPPKGNKVGVAALGIAVLGAVLAIAVVAVPFLVFISGLLLFVAFIVSIVGLTRSGLKKTTSVIALVGSLVFGVVGPMLFAGRLVTDVSTSMSKGSTPDTSKAASIGQKVTNSDGVEFTVNSVKCGAKKITQSGMDTKARGQFCVVKTYIKNGSPDMVTLSTSDITGLIGDKSYKADSMASDLGGDKVLTNINPGLNLTASFAIDIPAKGKMEFVQLRPTWSFQDSVVVKVS